MSDRSKNELTYVEFCSSDLEKTHSFLEQVFGWAFENYGDDYKDVKGAGIGLGITQSEPRPPLAIVQSDDLEATLKSVKNAGAKITKEIFSFPGGRRFHFEEPGGNEMAVWSTE